MRRLVIIFLIGILCVISGQTFAEGLDSLKVGPNIYIGESNGNTIFIHDGNHEGLKSYFLNMGVTRADFYQVIAKENNEFHYALAGDIKVGDMVISSLQAYLAPPKSVVAIPPTQEEVLLPSLTKNFVGIPKTEVEGKAAKSLTSEEKLQLLKDGLKKYVHEHRANFVFAPSEENAFQEKNNTFYTTINGHMIKDGIDYNEVFYVKIYNDKYYGPAIRFLMINGKETARFSKVIDAIMNSK